MVLAPRLEQRQSQTLVMTPQLQQAIKLLQLSNMELAEFVAEELEKNPLLEREDTVVETANADLADNLASDGNSDEDYGRLDLNSDGNTGSAEQSLDVDYDQQGVEGPTLDPAGMATYADTQTSSGGSFDADGVGFEERLEGIVTLRNHLLEQLAMVIYDGPDRVIGQYLIDGLDGAGYLVESIENIAETLGIAPARVEAVLVKVQGFEPVGVFARDLADCLAIQLRDKNTYDPAMQALVANLDVLAQRDFTQLEALCGVDREDILDMVEEIRALDPKPAHAFDGAEAQPITPDVLLGRRADGTWLIDLNPESLPRVLVNHRYHAEITSVALGRDDKRYLAEQLQSANWLVRALHQRATTIMKVSEEIVRRQDAFFRHGVEHLKPMILRDVADAIDMHESTVSRVTANKYVSAPRGLFELKYFFTTAIASSSGGDALSAESVRQKIRSLVDNEDPKKVLSDDSLVKVLRAEGIDIARRTVAKYRESLRIPSSVERRRQKSEPK